VVNRCIGRFIARGWAIYQSFHRSRSGVVSVVPIRGRALYQSFHRSRSGVVSVALSLAVGRCISRSIARGRALYQSFHCSRSGVIVSVAPLQWSVVEPVVQSSQSVVPKLTFSSYIRCSIARGHSFHHSFHLSRHCFSRSIAGGQSLYQSFIACCQSLYSLFHHLQSVLGSVVSSLSSYFTAHGQSLYQSLCSKSVISRRGEYM